jgi:hypothetical protein
MRIKIHYKRGKTNMKNYEDMTKEELNKELEILNKEFEEHDRSKIFSSGWWKPNYAMLGLILALAMIAMFIGMDIY